MICPVKVANEVSGLSGTLRSSMTRCSHEATKRSLIGAGDKTTGRHVAGNGQTAYLVSGGGDPEHQLPADAALEDTLEQKGYEGLFERRRGIRSPKRVSLETVATALRLYHIIR